MKYLFESKNLCFRRFEITDEPVLFEHHLEPELKEWIPNEVYEDLERYCNNKIKFIFLMLL